MKTRLAILVFSLVISCTNSRKKDRYEIYNTVLREKVSTYGILHQYISFRNNQSEKEMNLEAERISDSLKNSKSLTYFLDQRLTILDTTNLSDEFYEGKGDNLVIQFKPQYSKENIDFSKIQGVEFAKRIDHSKAIDENGKQTYLGNYVLSEPVFIAENKALIRYQHHCGSKCGLGILITMEKVKDKWKIINEKLIWIS
ncbi:MAG: hypothetical protein KA289_01615 [Kaistella sp.]|nr:hypothetical protein [Kaistella sp.]